MAEEKKPTGRGRKKKNPETADAAKKSTAASTKKTTKATTAKAPAGGSADPEGKRAGGPGGTYPGGKRADDGGAGNLNKTNPEGGKKNVTRSIRNG